MEHTTLSQMCRSRIGKHLHMRGAYGQALATEAGKAETSPHPWSILGQEQSLLYLVRNISTSVEHTYISTSAADYNKKHLHIRGAYSIRICNKRHLRETSPHPWSIHDGEYWREADERNISTSVEHTQPCAHASRHDWKHLHIRGAYSNI